MSKLYNETLINVHLYSEIILASVCAFCRCSARSCSYLQTVLYRVFNMWL